MRIAPGDRGEAVADVQRRLVGLGYELGPTDVDGIFAQHTQEAVLQFQATCRLPETGEIDTRTWRALVGATYGLGDRAIYLRTPFFFGNDVRDLQERLGALGFHFGDIDGLFGPQTDAALREFQHNCGLVADSILGPSTLTALESLDRIIHRDTTRTWPDSARLNSSITALEGRTIAITCSSLLTEPWPMADNPDIFSADLAYRLATFIELFGGEIALRGDDDENPNQARARFVFILYEGPPEVTTIVIEHDSSDKKATVLATAIESKLRHFVTHAEVKLEATGEPTLVSLLPTVTLRCMQGEDLNDAEPMQIDIFRQRVACAVFDGLKIFLETTPAI